MPINFAELNAELLAEMTPEQRARCEARGTYKLGMKTPCAASPDGQSDLLRMIAITLTGPIVVLGLCVALTLTATDAGTPAREMAVSVFAILSLLTLVAVPVLVVAARRGDQ